MLVIDSFKALRTFASSDADYRRFLHELAGRLADRGVLVVGRRVRTCRQHDAHEFAVADAVIGVETKRSSERSIRYLTVRKLRGSDYLSGDHVYRITADGLVVFPRLADPYDESPHPTIAPSVCRPGSPLSTTPSRMATGPGRRRWSPDRRAPARP